MKSFKFLIVFAATLVVASSCNRATVSGKFESVPSGKVLYAKTIEGAQLRTVDSVMIADDGTFRYTPELKKGQPEFYYLYYGNTKVASLLLESEDKVSVLCDTLGKWLTQGSEACEQLRIREVELSDFISKGRISGKDFIEFYRSNLRFVLENSKSLVSVPVLFSKVGQTAVFCQPSDGLVFNKVADSLERVYPESRYVKMLRNEGALRVRQMELSSLLLAANEASYIDLNFDGMDGHPVTLSDYANDNTTLLMFWNPANAADKMFLKETMEPLYEKYAPLGLKIYSVGIGVDKTSWAIAVRDQNMPWISVCDPTGRSISAYSIASTPVVLILDKGRIVKPSTPNVNDLEFELSKILK